MWTTCKYGVVVLLAIAVDAGLVSWTGASDFNVSPVEVHLSESAPTEVFTVTNRGDQELRLQFQLFAWRQGEDSKDALTPSDHVVIFPTLLKVGPREQRLVRVASQSPSVAFEKAYRVLVKELPPLEPTKPSLPASKVTILTDLSIPIFVEPIQPLIVHEPRFEHLRMGHGLFAFDLKNSGTMHMMVLKLKALGIGPSGQLVFERDLSTPFYLLPGAFHPMALHVKQDFCVETHTLVLEGTGEAAERFSQSFDINTADCNGAHPSGVRGSVLNEP